LLALGVVPPVYAHVPMILGADGAKLSKRHGAVSVLQYQEQGYLPDALLNYLVRLGWAHGDQEVFTRAQMIAAFDIAQVGKAAAAFNAEKLLWLNQQHMMKAPVATLAAGLREQLARLGVVSDNQPLLEGVANAQRERSKTLQEMAVNSLFFFRELGQVDPVVARKHLTPEAAPMLGAVRNGLAALSGGEWNAGAIHDLITSVATRYDVGLGKVAQPLRVALTGSSVSPPIDVTIALLAPVAALGRLDRVLAAVT